MAAWMGDLELLKPFVERLQSELVREVQLGWTTESADRPLPDRHPGRAPLGQPLGELR